MKLKRKSELKSLIHVFLNATSEPNFEPVYLFNGTYYRLSSVRNCKNEKRIISLVETDIDGDDIHNENIIVFVDADTFRSSAKIVGTYKKTKRNTSQKMCGTPDINHV